MSALKCADNLQHTILMLPSSTLERCVECPSILKILTLSTHLGLIQQIRGLLHFLFTPAVLFCFGPGALYQLFFDRPSPNVYFPFGIGHRSCIAKHFAMVTLNLINYPVPLCELLYQHTTQMEAKLILLRLVQNFKVTFPDGYKLDLVERISKYPRDDVMCTLLTRF